MTRTAEKSNCLEDEFDFVRAIKGISKIENSSLKGDYHALKAELGDEAFKIMANLGYFRGGFYILNGEVIDTYCVSQNYEFWNRRIKRQAFWKKIFPTVSFFNHL
jgi:hypothetical protein